MDICLSVSDDIHVLDSWKPCKAVHSFCALCNSAVIISQAEADMETLVERYKVCEIISHFRLDGVVSCFCYNTCRM